MSRSPGFAAAKIFIPIVLIAVVVSTVILYTKGGSIRPSSDKPVINFIGMATGTLATDVNTLKFADRFAVKDYNLVGVVGFDSIKDGAVVQATWFSPDDRSMPLGRTEIVTQSGAKIAKFSIANNADWKPSPFMLDIRVFSQDQKETNYTASGSTHFFIGMSDEDIGAYIEDFTAFKQAEAEEARVRAEELAADELLLESVRSGLDSKNAAIAARHDINGDGKYEVIVTDPAPNNEAFMQHLVEMDLEQFMIFNKGSGTSLLSLRNVKKEKVIRNPELGQIGEPLRTSKSVHATFSLSGDVLLEWKEDDKNCRSLLHYGSGAYAESERSCLYED